MSTEEIKTETKVEEEKKGGKQNNEDNANTLALQKQIENLSKQIELFSKAAKAEVKDIPMEIQTEIELSPEQEQEKYLRDLNNKRNKFRYETRHGTDRDKRVRNQPMAEEMIVVDILSKNPALAKEAQGELEQGKRGDYNALLRDGYDTYMDKEEMIRKMGDNPKRFHDGYDRHISTSEVTLQDRMEELLNKTSIY